VNRRGFLRGLVGVVIAAAAGPLLPVPKWSALFNAKTQLLTTEYFGVRTVYDLRAMTLERMAKWWAQVFDQMFYVELTRGLNP
jgi:hypothetical protein